MDVTGHLFRRSNEIHMYIRQNLVQTYRFCSNLAPTLLHRVQQSANSLCRLFRIYSFDLCTNCLSRELVRGTQDPKYRTPEFSTENLTRGNEPRK